MDRFGKKVRNYSIGKICLEFFNFKDLPKVPSWNQSNYSLINITKRKISPNQLFDKNVTFTKFLPKKCESKFLWFWLCGHYSNWFHEILEMTKKLLKSWSDEIFFQHSVEITEFYHHFFAKIPWKYLFTKELYFDLTTKNCMAVNFSVFHTSVDCVESKWFIFITVCNCTLRFDKNKNEII